MAGFFETIVVCALTLTGCPSGPGPVVNPNGTGSHGTDTHDEAATSPRVGAVARLLDDGRLDEASEALDALLVNDALSGTAIGDLLTGRLERARGNVDGALEAFERAASAADAPAVAAAARLYAALVEAERGDVDAAMSQLVVDFDEPNLHIGLPDRAALWLLVAEASASSGDTVRAVEQLSAGFDAAETAGQLDLATYIQARAFELGAIIDAESMPWPETAGALARAALADRLVRQRAAGGDAVGAEDALRDATAALAAIGDVARIAELEQLVRLDATTTGRALIGVVLPLTGDSRRVGRRLLAGILQAQGTFFPGGGRRLTVVFEDSGSDPASAVAAVQRIDALGALAVIGPIDGAAATAAAEEAVRLDLPLISLALDDRAAQLGAFHFGIDVGDELAAVADHLALLGRTRLLVIRPETPFGEAMTDRFVARFEAAGGEVVDTLTYESGATDLRKLASAAERKRFDTVFVPDTAQAAARVASFLAQENIWSWPADFVPTAREARRFVTFVGPSTWYDGLDLAESELRYLDGALLATSYAIERDTDENALFVETFGALYGRSPGLYEALAFDLTRLLRELIMNRGHGERAALENALTSTSTRLGVIGEFGFEDRAASPSPIVLRVGTSGVAVAPAPVAAEASEDAPQTAPAVSPTPPAGETTDGALPPSTLE